MVFTPGMRVLEIGCCEADWLHGAHAAWPDIDLVGIDTRAPDVVDGDGMVTRRRADARDPELFPAESFDAIVSLSAIEHVGLGHYGDPLDPDGDTTAIAHAWRWLKPGGWLYFDVPYDPTGYRVQGTEYRVYDNGEFWKRLWQTPLATAKARARWLWDGYSEARDAGRLVDTPISAVAPFHYAAMVWRKC